jgi:hypothetical protein
MARGSLGLAGGGDYDNQHNEGTTIMKRSHVLGLLLLAIFASASFETSSVAALETNNPRFENCTEVEKSAGKFTNRGCTSGAGSWETKILVAGEEAGYLIEASGNQTILIKASSTLAIKCTSVASKTNSEFTGSRFIGSNLPNAGKTLETLEYKGCEIEGKAKCEVKSPGVPGGTVLTTLLKSKEVYSTKTGAIDENQSETKTLIEPAERTLIATIEFAVKSGQMEEFPCPSKSTVEGKILAENIKASEHLEKHEQSFKEGAYWENVSNKTSAEQKVGTLTAFGVPTTISGKSLVYYYWFVNGAFYWWWT